MLPRPNWPRAVHSRLWQNWLCGSIGVSPGTRFGDHARRNAWWARVFQAPTPRITVQWGATEVVRRFVKAGGGLVATFETSLYDPDFTKRDDFALADLFRAGYVGTDVV